MTVQSRASCGIPIQFIDRVVLGGQEARKSGKGHLIVVSIATFGVFDPTQLAVQRLGQQPYIPQLGQGQIFPAAIVRTRSMIVQSQEQAEKIFGIEGGRLR